MENSKVLHIVWKGLLVSPPNVPQWGYLRRRSTLCSSHIHPDVSVQETALEYDDAASVNVAFDDRVRLNLHSLRRRHSANDATAQNNFFGLDVALDYARATNDDLSRAAD